jgi:hypothetical protein
MTSRRTPGRQALRCLEHASSRTSRTTQATGRSTSSGASTEGSSSRARPGSTTPLPTRGTPAAHPFPIPWEEAVRTSWTSTSTWPGASAVARRRCTTATTSRVTAGPRGRLFRHLSTSRQPDQVTVWPTSWVAERRPSPISGDSSRRSGGPRRARSTRRMRTTRHKTSGHPGRL